MSLMDKDSKTNSKVAGIAAMAWVLGVMVSPDTLVMLGNGLGTIGWAFLWILPLSMGFHLLHAAGYRKLALRQSGCSGEVYFVKSTIGWLPPALFPIFSRAFFAVFAATGILVSAGFVFNEVFVYWFPNFSLAFILLAVVSSLHFISEVLAERSQIVFVGIALLGIMILSLAGLVGGGGPAAVEIQQSGHFELHGLLLFGFIFVGFDLLCFSKICGGKADRSLAGMMLTGIVFAALIFAAWAMVSLSAVPAEKLRDTTIPHIIAARHVLGQTGRILIGISVISGACATVNALFMAISRMVDSTIKDGVLFRTAFASKPNPRLVTVAVLAVTTAVLMATGFAGDDVLEDFITAGLLMWIVNYGVLHLAFLIQSRRQKAMPNRAVSLHLVGLGLTIFYVISVLVFS